MAPSRERTKNKMPQGCRPVNRLRAKTCESTRSFFAAFADDTTKNENPGDRPGFSFQCSAGNSARASSSAARHRPHITIIGIQNRNGMRLSSVVSWRDNAGNATTLRQDFVIGKRQGVMEQFAGTRSQSALRSGNPVPAAP